MSNIIALLIKSNHALNSGQEFVHRVTKRPSRARLTQSTLNAHKNKLLLQSTLTHVSGTAHVLSVARSNKLMHMSVECLKLSSGCRTELC